jgi:hypothetical protein
MVKQEKPPIIIRYTGKESGVDFIRNLMKGYEELVVIHNIPGNEQVSTRYGLLHLLREALIREQKEVDDCTVSLFKGKS